MYNETNVKVNKNDLLTKLKANREIHSTEYAEMKEEYRLSAVKGLQKMVRDAKKGNIKLSLQISKPTNYTDEYDEIIGMLEMSVEDTFVITQEEYKQYVLNIWNWSASNNLMKTSYLSSTR
jgi:hypothetical protein